MGTKIEWTDEDKRRFWSKVRKSDNCWWWQAGLFSNGYGQFRLGKKKIKAHCFVYMICFGEIPASKIVCHTCDNKKCVNPAHLFLGTHKDNAQDRDKKGRSGDGGSKTKKQTGMVMGENNPAAKLSVIQVRYIRMLWEQDFWTQRGLARKFGVSQSQIANIIHRRSWKNVR